MQQIRLLTGLNVGGKKPIIGISCYSTRFAAMLQDQLHFFGCPFFRTLSITPFSFFVYKYINWSFASLFPMLNLYIMKVTVFV